MAQKLSCDINFDSPTDSYNAGQTVFGDIDINVNEITKVKGLFLHVRGMANCRWPLGKRSVMGEESILNSKINLAPNEIDLTCGNHKYKFNFVLPSMIPSTTEAELKRRKYQIKYEVVIYFILPWKFDIKFSKEFKVYCGLNLNMNLELKARESEENMHLLVTVPRTGYVPGEKIPVDVQVKTISNDRFQCITFALYKEISHRFKKNYIEQSHSYSDKIIQSEVKFNHGQSSYKMNLKIPEENIVVSTTDPDMQFIKIDYRLSVKLHIKGTIFNTTSDVDIPIIVGSVPFERTNEKH